MIWFEISPYDENILQKAFTFHLTPTDIWTERVGAAFLQMLKPSWVKWWIKKKPNTWGHQEDFSIWDRSRVFKNYIWTSQTVIRIKNSWNQHENNNICPRSQIRIGSCWRKQDVSIHVPSDTGRLKAAPQMLSRQFHSSALCFHISGVKMDPILWSAFARN